MKFIDIAEDRFQVEPYGSGFRVHHENLASGYKAVYEGAGQVWKRTTRDRHGRSVDMVSGKALIQQLQRVTEATNE